MSFLGYWLPSQPQINDPARLKRPTRPMAQPPTSSAENRRAEERHAYRLVGNVRGKMQPDKCHVKAAHEEANGEQPEALRLERLLQSIFGALRDSRAGLWGLRASFSQC